MPVRRVRLLRRVMAIAAYVQSIGVWEVAKKHLPVREALFELGFTTGPALGMQTPNGPGKSSLLA